MEIDRIVEGDCLEELPKIDDNSIDAIVTDPPAAINFMQKSWDSDKGGRTQWIAWMSQVAAECLRVIKPGGHALVWALPRTSHWTGMAWEEAGWEPRDKISHVFGSGFPKSLDISKKLDQMAGAEREIIGIDENKLARYGPNREDQTWAGWRLHAPAQDAAKITAPATPAAKQWAGWGSAIKPSHEDWWLFRKPLACKTIAENVLEWGCGGLNIDGCRVEMNGETWPGNADNAHNDYSGKVFGKFDQQYAKPSNPIGRFPSNLIWSHSPNCKRIGTKKIKGTVRGNGNAPIGEPSNGAIPPMRRGSLIDRTDADGLEEVESWDCAPDCPSWEFAKAGDRKVGFFNGHRNKPKTKNDFGIFKLQDEAPSHEASTGSAARFFKSLQFTEEDIPAFAYFAKASKSERGEGNNHPTVKSLSLMRYLCRLITPPNGLILDPFAGSGTTLLAAKQEGFRFLGIEKEAEYCDICRKRIAAIPRKLTDF